MPPKTNEEYLKIQMEKHDAYMKELRASHERERDREQNRQPVIIGTTGDFDSGTVVVNQ